MNYFEDLVVGESIVLGRCTFTAETIKSFAGRYDPQPFHLDENAAAASHFGALCASGWQTATVWTGLLLEYRRGLAEKARARGESVGHCGPGAGLRDLKWLKPVYAGDTVEYRIEVIEKRPSNSKPGFGLMTNLITGTNQTGERVISFLIVMFIERRGAEP
jgi:acyl dehydratase